MEHVDKQVISQIHYYLDQQGLTFAPLRQEMTDHLICDLEEQMQLGKTFEDAWRRVTGDIPNNHFKTIQQETMEAINKRFNLSKVFTYISLGLLFATSMFKMLHLPGATILLITSFVAIALALFTGTISGIRLHKEKPGTLMLLIAVAGVVLYLVSWVFQIVKPSSSTEIRAVATIVLTIIFPSLTVYFNMTPSKKGNILTYLHEKYTPGIERFLITLLLLGLLLKISSMQFGYPPVISQVMLVLVISGAGMQFFALTWNKELLGTEGQNWSTTIGLILGFICFLIPGLGNTVMPFPTRAIISIGFYLVAAFVLLNRKNVDYSRGSLTVMVVVSLIYTGIWVADVHMAVPEQIKSFIYNPLGFIILIAAIYYFRKDSFAKTYLILLLAHYIYFYPNQQIVL